MGGCTSQQKNLVSLADAKKKDKQKGFHKAKAKSSDFEIAFTGKLEMLSCNVDGLISEWYSVNDFFSQKMDIVLETCGIFSKQNTQPSKEAILEKLKSEGQWKCYIEELVLIIGRASRKLNNLEQRLSDVSQQVEQLNDMEMQLLRAQKSKVVYKIEKAKQIGTLHSELEEWNNVIKMSLGFTYTDLKLRKRSSKKLSYVSPIEKQRKGLERSNTISFKTYTRVSSILPMNSNQPTTNYQNTNSPGIYTNSSMNFSFQAG